MRIRRLRTKIALVFVLMILAVQVAVQIATANALNLAARNQTDMQLAIGDRIFHKALQSEAQRLQQAALIAAADFGFREAVALHDNTTVRSALQNQRERLGADISILVGLDSRIEASTSPFAAVGQVFPYPAIIGRQAHRAASLIGMFGGRPYELVSVPVRTPLTVAWMVMGLAIDDMLARDMHSIAGLDISFMVRGVDARWKVFASSRSLSDRVSLEAAAASGAFALTVGSTHQNIDGYRSRIIWLAPGHDPMMVVLQKSLVETSAPFRELRSTLLLIMLCGVAISVIGATLIARSVTQSLGELTRFSERVGRGDYGVPIQIRTDDETGELAGAFQKMSNDIAKREARITELAYMDYLTGLPNRVSFNDWLLREIDNGSRNNRPFAVMLMDLDRFKYVNDTLGHYVGDRLLHDVARRLAHCLDDSRGTVARLGGDEFAILLPGNGLDEAQHQAALLHKALEVPMDVDGQPVDVGASIGIVSFPVDGTDMHTLLLRADIAMYAAKRANTGIAVFDHDADRHDLERLSLGGELRRAVENSELQLYYQPKIDLADNAMTHVEALVRWKHPERGMVSPADFIPFAEQTGFIRLISRWIATEAVTQCARWREQRLELTVSINFSTRDLMDTSAPDWLAALLEEHGVDPQRLQIEITESALMDDPVKALATLERFDALGIRMSIDDFGTGYSSLSYLKRMPVNELKIDRSFVSGLTRDVDDEFIVRSTIALAHNMGLSVVAEGVEDEATLKKLRALGCDMAQGYYIGHPVGADGIATWLANWNRSLLAHHEKQT